MSLFSLLNDYVSNRYVCILAVIRLQDFTSITVGLILFLVNFVLLCIHFEPAQWYIILFYAGLYVLYIILLYAGFIIFYAGLYVWYIVLFYAGLHVLYIVLFYAGLHVLYIILFYAGLYVWYIILFYAGLYVCRAGLSPSDARSPRNGGPWKCC